MSRKNVFWSALLVLICSALLVLSASAQHFQQVKGTLVSVAAGRNEVFGIGPTGLPWRYNASKQSFEKVAGATSLVQIAVGGGTLSQLDEVWAENLETLCSLGMQPRQKAELIYDRHRFRIGGQRDFAIHAGKKQSGVAT